MATGTMSAAASGRSAAIRPAVCVISSPSGEPAAEAVEHPLMRLRHAQERGFRGGDDAAAELPGQHELQRLRARRNLECRLDRDRQAGIEPAEMSGQQLAARAELTQRVEGE